MATKTKYITLQIGDAGGVTSEHMYLQRGFCLTVGDKYPDELIAKLFTLNVTDVGYELLIDSTRFSQIGHGGKT